ncbi:DUF2075 domain-containing protein, partial [Corynebacterium sp. MSK044]|uniref:DNA/RNA helicase domain-containing protein n=1 Tax=Corynebacterium sp. MSK044 TaxID=3050195 RepID=UPI002550EB81
PGVTGYSPGRYSILTMALLNRWSEQEIDGEEKKLDVSQELLRNQLNVLLTRGVRGMGIYAVDEELREELKKAAKKEDWVC